MVVKTGSLVRYDSGLGKELTKHAMSKGWHMFSGRADVSSGSVSTMIHPGLVGECRGRRCMTLSLMIGRSNRWN
jgi:hypothetical protein